MVSSTPPTEVAGQGTPYTRPPPPVTSLSELRCITFIRRAWISTSYAIITGQDYIC